MKLQIPILLTVLLTSLSARAESDAELRQKILGLWYTGRTEATYRQNGTFTLTNMKSPGVVNHGTWSIHNGILIEDIRVHWSGQPARRLHDAGKIEFKGPTTLWIYSKEGGHRSWDRG
jgi:hypothetical protein